MSKIGAKVRPKIVRYSAINIPIKETIVVIASGNIYNPNQNQEKEAGDSCKENS